MLPTRSFASLSCAVMFLAMLALGCARARDGGGGGGGARAEDRPAPAPSGPPRTVTGTDWVLVRLGDAPAHPDDRRARPWFRLDPGDRRAVTGNTGVNHLSGTYELSGGALQFGPLITTRRAAAPELMRQETAFLAALEHTATADARGDVLDLRDAAGSTLARFEAKNIAP